MNYYSHHIGDYTSDTAHLSILEDGAYRRLMDRYYMTEAPLTLDEAALFRVIRARSQDEQEAARVVLAEFFTQEADGWHHKRCDAEIAAFRAKSGKAAEAANKRWNKPGNADAMPPQCERNASAMPTNNQEPITKNQEERAEHAPEQSPEAPQRKKPDASASRLPADWSPSVADIEFCHAERPDLDAYQVGNRFRDYWVAQPGAKGRKTDWPATWRNWVRNEKAVQQARASPGYQTANDKAKAWADRLTGRNRNDQHAHPDIVDINPAPYKLG